MDTLTDTLQNLVRQRVSYTLYKRFRKVYYRMVDSTVEERCIR